jgi:cellulose synthase operon protein C
LAEIPADRLTIALDARLAGLLARVIARPEPEARIGLLQRTRYLALVDPERRLLAACRDRLVSPYDEEVRAAIAAVLARSTEIDMPALGVALDRVRSDPRALHVAAAALCSHNVRGRASWRMAASEFERVALRDPRWSRLAIQVAAARGRADDLLAVLVAIGERGPLDVDAALAARAAIVAVRDDELASVVATLAASPLPPLRRIAVDALAHDARSDRGWTDARLALLASLRADDVPARARSRIPVSRALTPRVR